MSNLKRILNLHSALGVWCLAIVVSSALGQSSITDFTPKFGSAGDTVTVYGNGFATGMNTLRFWQNRTASYLTNSNTQITATVPSGVSNGQLSIQRSGGMENFSTSDFTVVGPGPYITDFSPAYGVVGANILINGVHFIGATAVKFNGTSASPPSVNAAGTTITVFVPAGASSGLISVTSPAGTGNSPTSFTVVGAGPYIASFSPSLGNVGDPVNLSGVHFSGTSSVKFNGVNASFTPPTSDTALTAMVPGGATTGPITVMNSSGSYTTISNFFLPPQLTGFSPINGRAGTNVLITGKNFTNATAVRFNGLDAASFNVLSSTQITAVLPVNATTGPIRVYAPGGNNPPSSNFVVLPTVTGFSPNAGPVGTSVTISGANLNVGTPVVRFNGTASSSVTGVMFNQLTATVPAGATTGPISVTTSDGSHTNANNFFLPPAITSFTPTNSAPGTTVTITGANFIGTTTVSFNGAPASFTPPTNNTTIRATVPAGVSTGPISVTTPAGTATSAAVFYAAPVINSFSPTHGLPGTNVTIFGTNFLGTTSVKFNGTNASINSVANGQIVATVPVGATTGPISVTAPAGTAVSAGNFVLDYTSDLTVTVTDAPDPVFVKSNLVYTIVVANNGPFNAPNVVLTDTLPASASIKAATTTQGSLATNGNPVIGTFGTINSGSSVFITLTVAPQSVGTITNVASVLSDYNDPAAANNGQTNTTTVLPLPVLSIRLSAPDRVRVSWAVELTNYTLQFKSLLATTNVWANVATAPAIVGNERVVTETNSNPMRFYRLKP